MSDAVLNRILTEIQALRVDVTARIERLQETVSSMREDVGVNFTRADVAGRSVAHSATS